MTGLPDHPAHPGDIGRRVRHRREQLGLSRAELAARAGMAEGYVGYLEENPAHLDPGQLLRLARALDLSELALSGGDVDLPPGRQDAAPHPRIQVLTEAECWALLGDAGIGRIAVMAAPDPSPLVVPLNYTVVDRTLVMRTDAGDLVDTTIERFGDACPASFEVDRIDEAEREGWSVLVRGHARTRLAADPEDFSPHPWAGGSRNKVVRLEPHQVTGRRIHAA